MVVDGVVPVAVEVVASDGQLLEVGFGDLLAERVVALVEVGFDGQASGRCGGGDEFDDGLVGSERLASSVHTAPRPPSVAGVWI